MTLEVFKNHEKDLNKMYFGITSHSYWFDKIFTKRYSYKIENTPITSLYIA